VTPDATPVLPNVDVQRVLVPLDGSELALHVLPTARALAERLGADLHAVTVAHGEREANRARKLAAAALHLPIDDEHVFVTTDGDPAETIATRAATLGSCVVCLATHGRGRLRGALVGSVARSVLLRVDELVVALGPMADNPGWSPRPTSWPDPLSVRRIVACVDGTESSEQVLPYAAAWARVLDMSLTILTVIDDGIEPIGVERVATRDLEAGNYVEQLVKRWGDVGVPIDGAVVRDPINVASGILAHLEKRPAGMVALTTHARSGIERARLGAAAANIVRASVAPCLVAPVRS
jgi:nucleotide-binding universal stress UspA family protein